MAREIPLTPEQEARLIAKIRAGDRGALGDLLTSYSKRVFHVCLRMVGRREDAADLTQEALLRAIRHIEDFKGDSRFGTWLMRIAMNLAISHLRRSKVRSTVSLEQEVGSGGQTAPLKTMLPSGRETSPQDHMETNDEIRKLAAAMQSLEVPLRSVLVLRDLQEMDYQQIADTLALPIGTVKSRLFRARVALRQAMDSSLTTIQRGRE